VEFIQITSGIFILVIGSYIALSLPKVKRNQAAAIYVRGKQKPVRVVKGPKIPFVPLGFKEIKIISTKPQSRVRPDPKKIQMDTESPLEGDKVYPLEISHSPFELAKFFSEPPTAEEKKTGPSLSFEDIKDDKRKKAIEMDLFQQSNTSRIRYVIRIKIDPNDSQSLYYFFKTTGSFERAWEVVTEAADAILEGLLAKMTMREAITRKTTIDTIFQNLLQQMVQEGAKIAPTSDTDSEEDKGEPYGFDIDKAFIEDISPNPAVKKAQDEAMAAQSKVNSEQQRIEAEAKNKKTTADADKYVKITSAEGDSEALKKRGEALEVKGAAMIFAADNVKEMMRGALVVDSDKAINIWMNTGLPNPLKNDRKNETTIK